jgi:hypothetical protein
MSFIGKWMELEIIKLREVSQTQKDEYHMFCFICGIKKEWGWGGHESKRETLREEAWDQVWGYKGG